MINKVIVFFGSNKDFNKLLEKRVLDNESKTYFMDFIQKLNILAKSNNSPELQKRIYVENFICKANDYSSVLEHVLDNFTNILSFYYDIDTLFV